MLPCSAMSRATTTCSGSFSVRAIASMMRMLAWCGMKHVQVVDADAGAVQRLLADLGHREAAQRKTGLALHHQVRHRTGRSEVDHVAPVLASAGSGRTARRRSPRRPGRCRARRSGPTTAAPAPSAKMNAVARSSRSVRSESRSTPITSTCRRCRRAPCPWPARGRSRSRRRRPRCRRRPACSVPSSCAIAVAMAGVWTCA